jgi:threonyl-tRNA synthetase
MWNQLKASYEADIAAKTPEPIDVTLPDGKVVQGQSWRTTPYDIAKGIR